MPKESVLGHDLSRQRIDINSPLSKNLDAMMAVDYRPIRPDFE
jgi:hypothetical protein